MEPSFEELDPETLEDIEVSLYGMIHHASIDEDFCNAASTSIQNNEDSLSPVTLKESSTKSSKSSSSEKSKIRPKSFFVETSSTPQPKVKGKSYKKNLLVTFKTTKQQLPIKRNPFSEYLVVEESMASSKVRKTKEVIILSDEEDSKYESINKSFVNRPGKIAARNIPTTNLSVVEDSDSEDSIIVLDTVPDSSNHRQSNSYINESDSESDVEIIRSSSSSPIDPDMKLNISSSGASDSLLNSAGISNLSFPNWEKYISKKWTPEMVNFYDNDGTVDLESVSRSFPRNVRWYVDPEDYDGGIQRNRYFGRKSRSRCANCCQWDHDTRNCRERKKLKGCNICGTLGHTSFGCPKKICLGCGRASKILIECCPECRRERKAVCMVCRQNHLTSQCPDLWRRYHSTVTEQDELVVSTKSLKPNSLLYCPNCSQRGHLAFNCPDIRGSKYPAVNPAVISYQNSREFLNSITNGGKSVVHVSDDRKDVWVVGNLPYRSPSRGRNQKYYIPMGRSTNEGAMQSVRNSVLAEIKNVNISWRNQIKKGRVLVEFTGQGDTAQAKMQFRKMINFRMSKINQPSTSKNTTSANSISSEKWNDEKWTISPRNDRSPSKSSAAEINLDKGKSLKKKENLVTTVSIVHLNHETKEIRRTVRCQLIEKEKKNLGRLLGKLEHKHRVKITSSWEGKKWELTINNLHQGSSSSAFYSILRFLDATSSRPAGV